MIVGDFVEHVAIEREVECRAHALVLAERIVGTCAVGDVEGDALIAEPGDRCGGELGP